MEYPNTLLASNSSLPDQYGDLSSANAAATPPKTSKTQPLAGETGAAYQARMQKQQGLLSGGIMGGASLLGGIADILAQPNYTPERGHAGIPSGSVGDVRAQSNPQMEFNRGGLPLDRQGIAQAMLARGYR